MNSPLVSINIPIYNVEKYIERCLLSVFNQTYQNIEIILVNDKTPDGSMLVVKRVLSDFSDRRIKIINHEKNEGTSIVRNNGILHSEGKYVYMLDSDDYITPDCIEKLVAVAEKDHSEIVMGGLICYDSITNEEKMLFPIRCESDVLEGNKAISEAYFKGQWTVIAPNKLYCREFILKNKLTFKDGLYIEDELWSFHCALKLNKISFVRDITYIYYLHDESITFNKTKKSFDSHRFIIGSFSEEYQKENDKKRKKWILAHIINSKELMLSMLWRAMPDDKNYWKENYDLLKKSPKLSFFDYFSNQVSNDIKKKNFFQNLPSNLGYYLFKYRWTRTFF